MFEHGNSVGAAFALFELGIGVNLGLIFWLAGLFGWRRVLVWLGLIVAATLVLAYATEGPLYFAHKEVSHTHAFDEWTSPFATGSQGDWQTVREKLLQKVEVLEPLSLCGLALLALVGLLARRLERHGRLEAWLTKAPLVRDEPVTVWNRNVPAPVLGLVVLAGLIAFSVIALYIYYPAPQEAFDEIVRIRAEAVTAVRSGQQEEAIRQIQYWDLLTRKLQVSVFIRTGRMVPEVTTATEDLRERLEELRDFLLTGNLGEAKEMLPRVEAAYKRCREVYLPVPEGNLGPSPARTEATRVSVP
jgi:hypothetical protein